MAYKYLLKRVHPTYQEYLSCWFKENLREGTVVTLKGDIFRKKWKIIKKYCIPNPSINLITV